ncbi:hypothetical protein [Candidatus Sororendozoicomonas aggregata]|uniref:hypothetical protein n=1 Tax=Candidatus Sororendozoicomonas aggregata TaxID=3073239 RepID=UPI002ED1F075
MKKILFVSYGGGHVNALLPIYERLVFSNIYECNYLALTTAYQKVKNVNKCCFGFKDLIGDGDLYALKKGKELVVNDTQNPLVSYNESVAYIGLSYMDLVKSFGETAASKKYKKYGRQAFYPIHTLKKYLSKNKPDLVVATNSPRAERAVIDAAFQLGIPSICLVDLFALQEIAWIGKPGFANKVCVISDAVRDKMMAAGRMADEVVVTGNPAFDYLSRYNDITSVRKFKKKKQWSNHERIVLWASAIEPEKHPFSDRVGDILLPIKIEEELVKLVRKNINIRLVIRPHPNESREFSQLPNGVEISRQEDDINELLPAVDCVVVTASTVGLQAALISKPLINIKLSLFSKDAPYDEMGFSMGVECLSELNDRVIECLNANTKNNALPKVGEAGANVIKVIDEMLY